MNENRAKSRGFARPAQKPLFKMHNCIIWAHFKVRERPLADFQIGHERQPREIARICAANPKTFLQNTPLHHLSALQGSGATSCRFSNRTWAKPREIARICAATPHHSDVQKPSVNRCNDRIYWRLLRTCQSGGHMTYPASQLAKKILKFPTYMISSFRIEGLTWWQRLVSHAAGLCVRVYSKRN